GAVEAGAAGVRSVAPDAGRRLFRFRIAQQPGELVTQNNVREALIDISDRKERVLYYEGEPRAEMKFINRAVADDKNLEVVTLQRTADNKSLRLRGANNGGLDRSFPTRG